MQKSITRIALLWGLAFGFLEIAYFSSANEAFPVAPSHFVAALILGAGWAAAAYIAGRAALLVSRRGAKGGESIASLLAGPWLLLTILALSHHRYRTDFFIRGMAKNFVSLAIIAVSIILFIAFHRLLASRRKSAPGVILAAGALLAVVGVFLLVTAHLPEFPVLPEDVNPVAEAGGVRDTGLRVLLVGIDGGPWKMLDPLMKRGKMPNLARIVSQGVTASMENVVPTYSPPIWTSIATGKTSAKHGIHDHVQTVLPLGLPTVPYKVRALRTLTIPARKVLRLSDAVFHYATAFSLSGHVRARRIWDILEEQGFPTVVVDWYITFPVENKIGIHVSDHFHLHRGKTSSIPGLIFPRSLAEPFEKMIIEPDELPGEKIDYLLDLDGLDAQGRRKLEEEFPDWFTMVRGGMARDLTHKAIIEAALPKEPDWRFAAVYFRAMDNMHHASWQYNDLPGGDLDEHPERRFRNAVRRYYEHCDDLLSELATYVDSNTVVIVNSDHGWENAAVGHNFGPDGFFVMAGGPTKGGTERRKIHIYDVTPTVLALLGFPVAQDMDGTVASDLVAPDFWREFPVREIPTYERAKTSRATADIEMDEETVKELKALGYIN